MSERSFRLICPSQRHRFKTLVAKLAYSFRRDARAQTLGLAAQVHLLHRRLGAKRAVGARAGRVRRHGGGGSGWQRGDVQLAHQRLREGGPVAGGGESVPQGLPPNISPFPSDNMAPDQQAESVQLMLV